MQTVKKHIKRRLLGIFTGMPEMFVREFSIVTICPNRGIISNAYGDAVLLQKTANRGPLPICQTIFLENVEALANEVTGGFPACQKKKGDREHGYIPFCVNGVCQNNTWEAKGKLDVNYCNQ